MQRLVIGTIQKYITDPIREDWKYKQNIFVGNDYLYIAYKDGGVYVQQHRSSWWEDGDTKPSLDISKIKYIHYWFAWPNIGGGETQVYINPNLGYKQTMEVLAEFMGFHYTQMEIDKNFPYQPETWDIPEKDEYEEV